jgi:hypothetical protein
MSGNVLEASSANVGKAVEALRAGKVRRHAHACTLARMHACTRTRARCPCPTAQRAPPAPGTPRCALSRDLRVALPPAGLRRAHGHAVRLCSLRHHTGGHSGEPTPVFPRARASGARQPAAAPPAGRPAAAAATPPQGLYQIKGRAEHVPLAICVADAADVPAFARTDGLPDGLLRAPPVPLRGARTAGCMLAARRAAAAPQLLAACSQLGSSAACADRAASTDRRRQGRCCQGPSPSS